MPQHRILVCPGLSFGLATRGDSTLHIADLIADGGIAPASFDVPALQKQFNSREWTHLPPMGVAELDEKIGAMRNDAELIVLGVQPEGATKEEDSGVLISSGEHPLLVPGNVLRQKDVSRLIDDLTE